MQQSKAFKILRTRLKTVPSYSFNGEQFRQTSGDSYSQIHRMLNGSQVSEDGDVDNDFQSMHSGINFASRLQQFEQMQQQHRMHSKIADSIALQFDLIYKGTEFHIPT